MKMSDMEYQSNDEVLCKDNFHQKYAENQHQKLVPDLYLVLVNSPK